MYFSLEEIEKELNRGGQNLIVKKLRIKLFNLIQKF